MIHLARVTDTAYFGGTKFQAEKVSRKADGGLEVLSKPLNVSYTTPFWSPAEGGFYGVPKEGCLVLISKVENGGYYFLKAVVDYPSLHAYNRKVINSEGFPTSLHFKGDLGCGLEVTEHFTKKDHNIRTSLVTGGGKKVELIDSVGIDCINIDNGMGDFIKLTRKPQTGILSGARSLLARVWGSISFVAQMGGIFLHVIEGGNIDLINNSKGEKASSPSNAKRHGNVNLQSKHADVNLYTKGKEGRIFIECLNKASGEKNVIQFKTHGSKSIIRLESAGSLELVAAENINMNAGGQVLINGASIDLQGGNPTGPTKKSTFSDTGVLPV